MADLKEIRLKKTMEIESKTLWDCHKHDYWSEEHIEECLSEMLSAYIGDSRNYIVDGAVLECDQMSSIPVQMYYKDGKLGIVGEGGSVETAYEMPPAGVSMPRFEVNPDETEICKFHALNAGQTANGLRFGVVSDRSCLRDKIEKENKEDGKDAASLRSMGNCKIMREADVLEIKKRQGMAKIYGTCYCLMKPDWQWINPYCMESVVDGCDTKPLNLTMPLAGIDVELAAPKCYHTSHHKTMKWDTKNGRQEEGLTMMSTLLCTRGGIITFKVSGQIYVENREDIQGIGSKDIVNVKEEIEKLLVQENGLQLVKEYLKRIKEDNPEYAQFLERLASHESSGKYNVVSASGTYLGRYQLGNTAFRDIGFKDNDNHWTDLARLLEVYDNDSFLKNEIAQEVAILYALRKDYLYVLTNGDDSRIGENADGVKVTTSGLIGAAHLVGAGAIHDAFSGEKSWDETKDGNGVKATVYMEEMGGLDLSGVLGGIG